MGTVETKKFYDLLAREYDSMTSFQDRLKKDESIYRSLVEKYHIQTALDAGAGTGVHSFLLAQSGVAVTAVDVSSKMLQYLSMHAKEKGLRVKIIKSDFLNLHNKVGHKFDAIFCMGNSLVHAKSYKELKKILSNFRSLLNQDGKLFIQILNYDRIIFNKEIIQNIRESNGKIFIRFYGFNGDEIEFNILMIEKINNILSHKIFTTKLHPLIYKQIVKLLKEVAFNNIKSTSNLDVGTFNLKKSKDLFIKAS